MGGSVLLQPPFQLWPQHGRQHKADRYGFAFSQTAVGLAQRIGGDMAFRLPAAVEHGGENRVDVGGHAKLLELHQTAGSMTGKQDFQQLVKQPRHRLALQQHGSFGNRRGGSGINFETEFARQTHRPQDTHGVFLIALGGVADHHQPPCADVGQTAAAVDDFAALTVVIQGVTGEIAAQCVLLERAVGVVVHNPAVLVAPHFSAAAKGADFNGFGTDHHMNDLKAAADNPAAAEDFAHFFGCGVGGDVKIFGLHAQQQIAHGSADQIGLIAGAMQALEHRFGGGAFDIEWVGVAFAGIFVVWFALAKNAVQPFFQHGVFLRQPEIRLRIQTQQDCRTKRGSRHNKLAASSPRKTGKIYKTKAEYPKVFGSGNSR